MAMVESWYEQDIKKLVVPITHEGVVFKSDSLANLFGVRVYDNGEPVSLSGTAQADIIRADGTTITQSGTVNGNECSVTLPSGAYAVSGALRINLKITENGSTTTLLNVMTKVYP